MTKLRIVCAAATLAATASGGALAETTANIGFMSDYIFRGYYQSESTPFAGIDIEGESGIYVGAWGANVKDGLEYDIYAGYAGGGENFTWYAGVTGYYYTDEFDDSYEELNLGLSAGFLTVDYALGNYNISEGATDWYGNPLPDYAVDHQSYEYLGLTFSPEVGPYYFVGMTEYSAVNTHNSTTGRIPGTAKQGYWFEIGKSFEIMPDLDISVAALYSGDVPQFPTNSPSSIKLGPAPIDLSAGAENAEYALVVTLTKTIRMGGNN